jgi:hypothetical protein
LTVIKLENRGNKYPNMRITVHRDIEKDFSFWFELGYHRTNEKHIDLEIYEFDPNSQFYEKRYANSIKKTHRFFFDSVLSSINFLEEWLSQNYNKTYRIDRSKLSSWACYF